MRKRILDQPIDTISIDEAVYQIKMALVHLRQFKIITLNSEMIVNASGNLEFQAAINNANLIVPDSIGIVWALKLLNPLHFADLKRIPGIELAEDILKAANELNKKVAIFGGSEEVLEKIILVINERYPNVQLVKTINGYKEKDKDSEAANIIASYKPDVVLVALGTPRQEIWINKYAFLFPQSIMIGIGGSLDVWSGKKIRAPEWVRNLYLEWFFRLIIDPQRVPRVLRTLPQFVWMVLKARM